MLQDSPKARADALRELADWCDARRQELIPFLKSRDRAPQALEFATELVRLLATLGLPVGKISTHDNRKQQQCHDLLLRTRDELRELARQAETSETLTPPAAIRPPGKEQDEGRDEFDKLPKARRLAYFAFQYAAEKTGTHPTKLLDRDAWDWLNENGIDEPDEIAGELANYRPPKNPATWVKYLGEARNALREQKHRRGTPAPTGHSVVRRDEL